MIETLAVFVFVLLVVVVIHEAGHLLVASVLSAPAALVVAKIMLPETETPTTAGGAAKKRRSPVCGTAVTSSESLRVAKAAAVEARWRSMRATKAAWNTGVALLGTVCVAPSRREA